MGFVEGIFTVANKSSYMLLWVYYSWYMNTDKTQAKNYCERIDLCKWTEDSIHKGLSSDNIWAFLISAVSVDCG